MGKYSLKLRRYFIVLFSTITFLVSCKPGLNNTPSLKEIKISNSSLISPNNKKTNNKSGLLSRFFRNTFSSNNEQTLNELIKSEVAVGENALSDEFYQLERATTYVLVLRFKNPDNKPIVSFRLNNTLIEKDYFTVDDWDYSQIFYNLKTSEKAGYYNFTVSDIKYQNNTQTHNVKINTKTNFTVAVRNDDNPTVKIDSLSFQDTVIIFDVSVLDTKDFLKAEDKIMLYVSDRYKIIHREEFVIGVNSAKLTNLKFNTEYEYAIVGIYDNNNGLGRNLYFLQSGEFKTLSGIVFDNITVTNSSVSYNTDFLDESINISHVELQDVQTKEILKTNDSGLSTFENLLSGYSYNIIVHYTYINNGETVVTQNNYRFETIAKQNPSGLIYLNDITHTSYEVEVFIDDPDDTIKDATVELILDNVLIEKVVIYDSKFLVFSNLLSGRLYDFSLNLNYDLNNKHGIQTSKYTTQFTTYNYNEPAITFYDIDSDFDIIDFEFVFEDLYRIGEISQINLLYNNKIVDSLDVKTFDTSFYSGTFTNLLSDTNYELQVKMTFDLNDGNGIKEKEYRVDITTRAKRLPEVTFYNTDSIVDEVFFDIEISDYDQVGHVSKIEIYHDNKLIDALPFGNGEEWPDNLVFTNLLSDTLYEIKVSYAYDLNNGEGLVEQQFSTTIMTKQITTPLIYFKSVKTTGTEVVFELTKNDPFDLIRVDASSLFYGPKLIATNEGSESFVFSNLASNRHYTIVVNYSYDLNDGKGRILKSLTSAEYNDFLNMIEPTDKFTIINGTLSSVDDDLGPIVYLNHSIGNNLFRDNSSIRELHLGPNVKSIGRCALSYMTNLTRVYFYTNTPPVIENSTFINTWESANFSIYVPESALETYKNINVNRWQEMLIPVIGPTKIKINDLGGYRDVITTKLITPNPEIIFNDIQNTYIDFAIKTNDPSNILNITNVSILKSAEVIETLNLNDILNYANLQFTHLTKAEQYLIKVEYEYDLNEGAGLLKSSLGRSFETQELFGKGTVTQPYLIEKPEDLRMIGFLPDKNFRITNDLDLSSIRWYTVPLFSGVIDGDNHIISNLKFIDDYVHTSTINYAFINKNNGILKNIHFVDVNVNLESEADQQISVVTLENSGQIINVSVSGYIKLTTTEDILFAPIANHFNEGSIFNVKVLLNLDLQANGNVLLAGVATNSQLGDGTYRSFEQIEIALFGKVTSTMQDVNIAGLSISGKNVAIANIKIDLDLDIVSKRQGMINGLFAEVYSSIIIQNVVASLNIDAVTDTTGTINGMLGHIRADVKNLIMHNNVVYIFAHTVNYDALSYDFGINEAQTMQIINTYYAGELYNDEVIYQEELNNMHPISRIEPDELYRRTFFYNFIALSSDIWEIDAIDYDNGALPYIKF